MELTKDDNNKLVFEFLELDLGRIDLDLIEFLDPEDLDDIEDAEDLFQALQEKHAFQVDITYYYKACEYLKLNDPSFSESLVLAYELGYDYDSLTSETLASLHASRKLEQDFWSISEELNKTLKKLYYV